MLEIFIERAKLISLERYKLGRSFRRKLLAVGLKIAYLDGMYLQVCLPKENICRTWRRKKKELQICSTGLFTSVN